MNKPRLLILDLIRIEAILAIVIFHFGSFFNVYPLNKEYYLFHTFYFALGQTGVYAFIFVSGAALAYSHSTDSVFRDLKGFYLKRLARIYPAVWVAMIIVLMLKPWRLYDVNLVNVIPIVTCTTAFFRMWGGPVHGGMWFIGVIVSLYILYPFVSRFIDWNPAWAMFILLEISLLSTLAIVYIGWVNAFGFGTTRWFPLCNLAVFGAGIFCIRIGGYPKWEVKNPLVIYLAALTFFVYLYNSIIWEVAAVSIPLYIVVLFTICTITMIFDDWLHEKIRGIIGRF